MNRINRSMNIILEKMWEKNPYDFRFVLIMTWERE